MRHLNRFRPLIRSTRQLVVAMASLCGAAHAGELTVVIENLQAAEGQVMIAVGTEESFAAAEGESRAHAVQVVLPAREGSVTFTPDALPDGTYAVQVMHDVNGNGELDANFVGMPKEPWGFSNNARGNFGPPQFADTQFALNGDTQITIAVKK